LIWLYRVFPSILNAIVIRPQNATGIRDRPTAARSRQNGHAERLIGSIRTARRRTNQPLKRENALNELFTANERLNGESGGHCPTGLGG